MRAHLETLCDGRSLTGAQTAELFSTLVRGELDPVEIAAMLVALRTKGEHPEEIAGAARALREAAEPFPRPDYDFADSCGTGGAGHHTLNISTAVAVVAAELDIPMCKHGNRSISSRCGSADVLERFGVRVDPPADLARRCLDEEGLCFLFAPQYHRGLRYAMPVRRTLGIRTVMNLLGPLVNPSRPPVQMLGVYDPELCEPVARTLDLLGCRKALVVHGSGLDEMALHGPTRAVRLSEGRLTDHCFTPADAGLHEHALEELRGGEPEENAACLADLLAGRGKPAYEDVVALNTGALAWIFGRCPDLVSATRLAREALRSGGCLKRLERFAELSHGA